MCTSGSGSVQPVSEVSELEPAQMVDVDMSIEDVSAFLRDHVKLPDRYCEAFEGTYFVRVKNQQVLTL